MTSPEQSMVYEESDERVERTHDAVMSYIRDGAVDGLPLEFRGLDFFAAVRALRENDDYLHSDEHSLEENQKMRLDEIEADLEQAYEKQLQYYPFGHVHNKSLAGMDKNARERAGQLTSWGVEARRGIGHRVSHAGELIVPPTGSRKN